MIGAALLLAFQSGAMSPFYAACLASGGAPGSPLNDAPIELLHSAEKQVFTITIPRDGSGAKLIVSGNPSGWVLAPGSVTIVSANSATLVPVSAYGTEYCLRLVK